MEVLAQYKGPLSEGIIIKIEVKLNLHLTPGIQYEFKNRGSKQSLSDNCESSGI